jgi:hypothetical protein
MFQLYENKSYAKVCDIGLHNFKEFKNDEKYISLYAFSCLYSDYIDRLIIPTTMLRYTEEARANAVYFSIILMQKKLLYHSMIDNLDLSSLKLPTTDYILSKVFDKYAKLGIHKKRNYYIFKDDEDDKISYKLYLIQDVKMTKMVIEEFYDTISVKRHIYW